MERHPPISVKTDLKWLLLLAVVVAAYFSHLLFTDKLLYGWDTVHNEYYWRMWTFGNIKKGVLPLWNPYILTGFPMFVNPSMAHFYPLNLMFVAMPIHLAIKASYIVHIYLLGAFQFLFLRVLKRTHFAAFCGAVALMFTGSVITGWLFTGNIAQMHATTWIPLSFLFVTLAWRQKKPGHLIPCAVVIGVQFLSGSMEIFFYSNVTLAAYIIALMAVSFKGQTLEERKGSLRFLAACVVMAIGALGLASAQFIPTLLSLGLMDRGGSIDVFRASLLAVPPENLITFLMPDFFGDGVNNFYWGDVIINLMTGYVGLLPFLFFVAAFFISRSSTLRIFLWMGAVALLLSMGGYTPVFWLFYNFVPGFDLFRFAPRWLMIFSLCCSVSFAFVLDYFLRLDGAPLKRFYAANGAMAKLTAVGTICFFAVSLLPELGMRLWKSFVSFSLFPPFKKGLITQIFDWSEFLEVSYEQAAGSFSRFLLLFAAYFVMLHFRKTLKVKGLPIQVFILALLLVDLFSFGRKYVMDYDHTKLLWKSEMTDFIEDKIQDGGRIATLTPMISLPLPKKVLLNYAILNKYSQSDINRGMVHKIPNVAGYIGMQLDRYLQTTAGLENPGLEFDMNFIIRQNIANLTGAKLYVLSNKKNYHSIQVNNPFSTDGIDVFVEALPGMTEVYRDDDYVILENPDAVNRFSFFRNDVRAVADGDKIREVILSPDTDYGDKIYLETRRAPLLKLTANQVEGAAVPLGWDEGEDRVEVVENAENRVSLKVNSKAHGFMMMTDAYYPGWVVKVDGVKVNPLRADYLFRAIPLRKGFHEVVMEFRPASLGWGIGVTGVFLALFAVLMTAYGLQNRQLARPKT